MKSRMDKLFWDKHFGYGIYIENLNYEAEDLIWGLIDKIDTIPADKQSEYIQAIYKRINYYNYLSKLSGSGSPRKKSYYKSIKDFFCRSYPEGKITFQKFAKTVNPKTAAEYNDSGLEEYIDFCASVIPGDIKAVLNDNPEDRHWSAVAVNGKIKSYLIIKNQFTDNQKPVDIKRYFTENGFSDEDYEKFEADRLKESAYYRGLQI